MVAILMFETAEIRVKDELLTSEVQHGLFGSTFEKLGQERRVAVLLAYHVIDASMKAEFDTVRTIRRRYLHLWSQDHARLPADAVRAFRAAVALVVRAIGQDVQGGKLLLRPSLVRYLRTRRPAQGIAGDEALDGSHVPAHAAAVR
jgi:hypothetical protein